MIHVLKNNYVHLRLIGLQLSWLGLIVVLFL